MTSHSFPDVLATGAITLTESVVCDGFAADAMIRVQTHIHGDHMAGFDRSKGFQYLYMSAPTRELLVCERNADLPYRENIRTLAPGELLEYDGDQLELLSSGHMLGAVQAQVTTSDGRRVGYSGDFSWPLDAVIQVDELVVDATYGSPRKRRLYSRVDVEARLLDLIERELRKGPVQIIAHRGTLHRVLQLMAGQIDCPILGTPAMVNEVGVYTSFGTTIDNVHSFDTPEAGLIQQNNCYVRFHRMKGDLAPAEHLPGTRIILSGFMSSPEDPVLEYSDRAFRVAFSDHADFDGTLAYVEATGAKRVITDNTRGGNAVTLANELRSRLRIDAMPSSNAGSLAWSE